MENTKNYSFFKLLGRQRDVFFLFLLTFIFYSFFRLEFMFWNWNQYQHSQKTDLLLSLLIGLRFDMSSLCFLIFPLFILAFIPFAEQLWLRLSFWVFLLIQIPFFVLNVIDMEFINFVGRRFTKQSLYIFGEASGKFSGFISTYALPILSQLAILFLFVWMIRKILARKVDFYKSQESHVQPKTAIFLVFTAFLFYVLGSRGGIQQKPVSFVDANVFITPVLNNLVLNTSFTVLKSLNKDPVARDKFFNEKSEMLSYLNGSVQGESLLEGMRPTQPQNIVIIIMESFALEYMGQVNGVKGYTPFLDELSSRPHTLFFKNGIANGRRSVEGIAALMTGIPALMAEPFISSEFTANYFVGMGSYLNSKKYHSSFFHGGKNGTMRFDSFMKSVGVEDYFGASEFPDQSQHDGVWGIFDEPFFQFFLQKLNGFTRPFAASFFSLSSHHPYRVPDQYKDQFPAGPIDILASISYADYSLRKFFENAEKETWFKDTLFIITADHTQKSYLPQYDNEISKWKIPIIFYHPDFSWPNVDADQIVQQIDILPSVLDFLDIKPKEKILLGRSVFIPGERTATTFVEGRYMLIAKDYFLDWNVGKDFRMYSMADPAQKNEQVNRERQTELVQRLKASIQYFNEGMWDNKLYFPDSLRQ